MSALLDELLEAHGGAHVLDGVGELRCRLTAGGLAFRSHRLPGRFELAATIDPHVPRVRFADLFGCGHEATFTADRVTLGDEVREHPRAAFGDLRHQVRWDALDFTYFSGYALWNYATTPWLLAHDGVEVEELPGRRLRATFPPDVPTHSARQVFHVGPDGLLARLDYTAEPFGRWARAAHVCRDHRRFGPLVAATRRRVTPRALGRPLPGPTLVFIELHALEPH